MISKFLTLAISAISAFFLLTGCTRPNGGEIFIKSGEAEDGVYIFQLPLTDSLASYDFWFYSCTGTKAITNLELKVLWLDPSGGSLSETVFMSKVEPKGSKELYRSGMVPARIGNWQLSVKPIGDLSELLGLGVEYHINDGTR